MFTFYCGWRLLQVSIIHRQIQVVPEEHLVLTESHTMTCGPIKAPRSKVHWNFSLLFMYSNATTSQLVSLVNSDIIILLGLLCILLPESQSWNQCYFLVLCVLVINFPQVSLLLCSPFPPETLGPDPSAPPPCFSFTGSHEACDVIVSISSASPGALDWYTVV